MVMTSCDIFEFIQINKYKKYHDDINWDTNLPFAIMCLAFRNKHNEKWKTAIALTSFRQWNVHTIDKDDTLTVHLKFVNIRGKIKGESMAELPPSHRSSTVCSHNTWMLHLRETWIPFLFSNWVPHSQLLIPEWLRTCSCISQHNKK